MMKHAIRKSIFCAAACVLTAFAAAAQPFLRLPAVIGDHMVLQENSNVKLYGWADPNTTVTVTPSWGEAVTVKAGHDTAWEVSVMTPDASSEPRSIRFETGKKVVDTVEDVLIGQVWMCSGQSNMNWSAANGVADMKRELEGEMNPQIRLFTVRKHSSVFPQEDCDGRWEVCNAETARYFSAVGYFFGKRLAAELGQPVGLVNSSWGGTPIEVWTPAEAMERDARMVASWKQHSKSNLGWSIGSVYNAMIHPLLKTVFAGVIWYQGESNKENAALYGDAFSMMIRSWRKGLGRELPFYFVQIAPHARTEGGITGAVVREQQARVAATVPGTGIVVISDLVDDVTNIHPRFKKEVGNRLSAWALAEVYGRNAGKYRHAAFRSVAFKHGQATVSFDHAEGGIFCKDDSVAGLEVCDASMKFVPAQGLIDAEGRLIVRSREVSRPVAVRYCFSDGAIGNLFDAAGLPVAPFRSDSDDSATPARLPDEAVSRIAVRAQGAGYEVRKLTAGAKFFINRVYGLTQVPERFEGFDMLVHAAGKESVQRCTVTAAEAGRLYIAVRRNSITSGDLGGWKPERNSEIRYATHDKNKPGILYLYYREVKAGQRVTLPRTRDFAGITLVAQHIEYVE